MFNVRQIYEDVTSTVIINSKANFPSLEPIEGNQSSSCQQIFIFD